MEHEGVQSLHGIAGKAETGRACPYCRFPLKEGAEMVSCGVCHAPHHADCWADNAGCAVVACAGGPGGQARQAPLPPAPRAQPTVIQSDAPAVPARHAQQQAFTHPASPPTWQPPAHPASSSGSRSRLWVVAAAVVAALVVAGSAMAVVITRKGGTSTAVTTVAPAATGSGGSASADGSAAPGATPTPEPVPAEPSSGGGVPTGSAARTEIQDVLYQHHEDIVNGDFRAAWNLLSERKKAQKLREDGYDSWASAQATLAPYLDPSGIHVSVQDINQATGEARVLVTGMTWSKPGASCSQWSGITWMKYEGGHWRYDPGYSTTPERKRLWKNRFSELLGGSC